MKRTVSPLRLGIPVLAALVVVPAVIATPAAQVAGRNVNMVTGGTFPGGDPYLQKQNEPSIAVSTRNPCHLLAGANDYRAVNLPGLPDDKEIGDAWLGWYESTDCGADLVQHARARLSAGRLGGGSRLAGEGSQRRRRSRRALGRGRDASTTSSLPSTAAATSASSPWRGGSITTIATRSSIPTCSPSVPTAPTTSGARAARSSTPARPRSRAAAPGSSSTSRAWRCSRPPPARA